MITGELKSKIDKIWNTISTGGISSPITVLEQITYLMFMKLLDDNETKKEGNASVLGIQYKSKIFKDDDFSVDDDGRWNAISLLECKEIQLHLSRLVDNDLNQAKGSLSFDSEDIITLFGPQVTVIRNIIVVMHNSIIAA